MVVTPATGLLSMDIVYSDFNLATDLTLNGDASFANGALNLTTAAADKAGSAFYNTALSIDASTSFQTSFQFKLYGGKGAGGSDGFAFVLQNSSAGLNAIGSKGGGLGYKNITNSLAIEFDTYQNSFDSNGNHLSLLGNGDVTTSLVSANPVFDLNSGSSRNAWIDYDAASDTLKVYISETAVKPTTELLSYNIDLAATLGSNAYFGFTAATGGLYNAQDIQNWKFSSSSIEDPGQLSLGQKTITVGEGSSSLSFNIIRTGGSYGTVAVDYATNSGEALDGVDYLGISGTATFLDGEVSKTLTVPIVNDTGVEGTETFFIDIGNAVGALAGTPRTAIISITDNDTVSTPSGSVAFKNSTYTVSESGGRAAITLTRTNSSKAGSVAYTLTSDSAKAGLDFSGVTGVVNFAVNELSKTFSIPVANDPLAERTEKLNMTLSNPVGMTLGTRKTATLAITDNDPLPTGFSLQTVVGNLFNGVTSFDWLPDGRMLIAEKTGIVSLFDGTSIQSFLDISQEVNDYNERGLLSIAVHPDLVNNPYLYLAYTYDPAGAFAGTNPENLDGSGPRGSYLVRYTVQASTNFTSVDPNSKFILLTVPEGNTVHASGDIVFGTDGSLFYSHGDGQQALKPTSAGNREKLQSLDYAFGKLLRINPLTGQGYSDNPFYNGDLNSLPSKVYDYGIRNAFRFAIHPTSNQPYLGDVGWNSWEEINTGRGLNFGWPYFEGANGVLAKTPTVKDYSDAIAFYASNPSITPAIWARSHTDGAISMMMGEFYIGSKYPSLYNGALFFGDYGEGSLEALLFDANGNPTQTTLISKTFTKGVVEILLGPDQNFYLANIQTGTISKLVYSG
jgi:glucose/arabinose dehydrogenase